jgi:hypothetical protein
MTARAAFRYCARAWDAMQNAPDEAARADAENLLCVNDAGRPITDRLASVLRAVLTPEAGVADQRARVLSFQTLLGADAPEIRRRMRAAMDPKALKRGTSSVADRISRAYHGSWLETAYARASTGRRDGPDAELEWTVDTLRGLDAALNTRGGINLPRFRAADNVPKFRSQGRLVRRGGVEYDAEGRSGLGKLASLALDLAERQLDERRGRYRQPAQQDVQAAPVPSVRESLTSRLELLRTMTDFFGGASPRADSAARPGGRSTAYNRHVRGASAPNSAEDSWLEFGEPYVFNRPVTRDSLFTGGNIITHKAAALAGVLGSLTGDLKIELGLNTSTALVVARPGHSGRPPRLGAAAPPDLTDADAFFDLFGHWIKDIFTSFVDKIDTDGWGSIFIDVGNWIVDILTCEYPLQVNTTRPYNLWCLPRIPEGVTSTIPDGPFTPAQVAWASVLIVVPCINDDWPDRVGYGRYLELHKDNCDYNDSYTPQRTGCPATPWCRREYDPEAVHMDLIDAGIMLIDKFGVLIYKLLYPSIGTGADSVDRVHWLTNFVIIVFVPRFLNAVLAAVPFVGALAGLIQPAVPVLGWALATWYAIVSGVLWPAVLTVIVWYAVSIAYNVAFWLVYGAYFVYGGLIWAYPDVVSWLATAVCTVTDTGMTWWIPLSQEMCYRLSVVAEHGDEAAYVQLWGLYFAKSVTFVLVGYVAATAIFWVAVAVVTQTFRFVYDIYVLIRLEMNRGRANEVEHKIENLEANVRASQVVALTGSVGRP